MSSHCLCRLGAALPKRVIHRPFFSARLQSQSAKKGQSSGVRSLLIYGGVVINGAVVGSILYAHHNPSFKHLADSYVPGFGALVDQSTAIWGTGQVVMREWWKKMRGLSDVGDKEEKMETATKQDDHILLAIKKKVEEETIRQAENKKTQANVPVSAKPNQTSPKTSAKPPEDTQPSLASTSKPPSSDKNNKQAAPSKQEKHTAANKTTSPSPKTSSMPALTTVPPASADMSKPSTPNTVSSPSSSDTTQASNTPNTTPSDSSTVTAPPSPPQQETKVTVVKSETVTNKPTLTSEDDDTAKLSRAYKQFAAESDLFLSSQQELAHAIVAHHLQQQETTKTPMSEEQRKVIAGSIVGTKQAVDSARKEVERARKRQREAADGLESAISATKDTAMVKQVYEKVHSYKEKIGEAGKVVGDTKTRARQWSQKQEEKSSEPAVQSRQDEISLDDQVEMEIQNRVVEALKKQRQSFDKEMSEMLNRVIEEKANNFEETLIQKEEEMERIHEQKLKDELLMQSRAHRYHLRETLEQQADQLSQEWSEELSTKLRDVEEAHLQEMVAAINELKGVQSIIGTVVETDRATRRQQSVRTACDALTRAIMTAESNPDPLQKHSISSQVSVLLQTGQEDQFITTVLSAIPSKAVVDGISSEAGLKTRFKHVRKICQRVALVPEEGAGLGTYLISYLQSLLIINVAHSHKADSTDTFDILREADTCISQGQLERAVKLINQLQGEPKRVARDWLREAKLYLETRQAVTVVAEYLAAASISVLK